TSMKGTLEALRGGGRGVSADTKKTRLRRALIVFEVALAMILLAGAGLLGRSFVALHQVDPGFRPDGVTAMRVALSSTRYREPAARVEFTDRLLERLRALPGIRAAGAVHSLPVAGLPSSSGFTIEGMPVTDPANEPSAEIRMVAGDYFSAMGIPLVRGRVFERTDVAGPARAFVIDETLAKRHFGTTDPIGRRITVEWGVPMPGTVVGVVGPVRQRSLAGPYLPTVYFWNAQETAPALEFVVRGSGSPETMERLLTQQVRALDPEQVVAEIRPLGDAVAGQVAGRRVVLTLVGFFASVALLLAALGLYGVISHSVVQRTREIGIRLALGATRRSVGAMVVRQGLTLTGLGLLAGIATVLALGRLLAGSLFGVPSWDPVSIAVAAGFLLAVALFASWLPARRALRTDPVTALRLE
ncbi:MAG TPA: FtsX-like permease family protein, partial [Candidatus Eisenbacteria bacterium]|nr:FtsX-like permease family protein [Candidatus Eisenbacteria bacterium]